MNNNNHILIYTVSLQQVMLNGSIKFPTIQNHIIHLQSTCSFQFLLVLMTTGVDLFVFIVPILATFIQLLMYLCVCVHVFMRQSVLLQQSDRFCLIDSMFNFFSFCLCLWLIISHTIWHMVHMILIVLVNT